MAALLTELINKQLITPPPFLKDNVHYEVMMGSVAYGVSDDTSDVDVYGFAIPPKHIIFPYHYGCIYGFDDYDPPEKFEQYQEHHILDKEAKKEYDITIYNIVKYFSLTAGGNPNMIDSLFVSQRCVLSCSRIGQMVRENRHLFLSKKLYHRFSGYAYSQLHKANSKSIKLWVELCNQYNLDPYKADTKDFPEDAQKYAKQLRKAVYTSGHITKRLDNVIKYGWDIKFGYHVVRLVLETEQLLETGDLDLERDREILKSIRRGEWSLDKVTDFFNSKEKYLRDLYEKSDLPYKPNLEAIKNLLLHCLEEHYGSLDKYVTYDKQVVTDLYKAMDFLAAAIKRIDKGDNNV